MKLNKDTHAEVQLAVLAKLKEMGVDVEHDDFAMVIMLVEPNGRGGQTLHLGAYHLADSEVLDVLEQAPECVRRTPNPTLIHTPTPTKPAVS